MTSEEAWERHEQWLLSIDSNLDRVAADLQAATSEFREGLAAVNASLAKTTEALANTTEAVGVVAQNQSNFSAALAALTRQAADHREEFAAHVRESAAEHHRLREGLDRLEQLIEQYIRSQGNGRN
jgi:ABC-type transporter Mla subunit MlaD